MFDRDRLRRIWAHYNNSRRGIKMLILNQYFWMMQPTLWNNFQITLWCMSKKYSPVQILKNSTGPFHFFIYNRDNLCSKTITWNQKSGDEFVRCNREFVIAVIFITEFECSLNLQVKKLASKCWWNLLVCHLQGDKAVK